MSEVKGERIVFTSLEHPNQEVVTGQTFYETRGDGTRIALHPNSVKFDNGRAIFDSIKDAGNIASLRAHKDYGTFIKELNEDKLREKIKLNAIQAEEVVCPHCNEAFSNLKDRNHHMVNCKAKSGVKMIRNDGVVQAELANQVSSEKMIQARIDAAVEEAVTKVVKSLTNDVKKENPESNADNKKAKVKDPASKAFDEQEEEIADESKSDNIKSAKGRKASVKA